MPRVLVIDADSEFASKLGSAIENAGHDAVIADETEGVTQAKSIGPDVMLLGSNVIDSAGVQIIEDLKPLVSGSIFVCADTNDPEQASEVTDTGAQAVLMKESGVESILEQAFASEEPAADDDPYAEDSDDEEEAKPDENEPKKAKPIITLRTPVKAGKRHFSVVVAHPDAEKRAFITEIIERNNESIRVVEVETGEEAVTACAEHRTVMLVINWEMPDVSVPQVMSNVRNADNGKPIALFVTHRGHSPEKQRRAMFLGALAFAGEPWDDGSLEGQLQHTMKLIRRRRRRAKIKALKAKLIQEAKEAKAAKIKALQEARAARKSQTGKPTPDARRSKAA